AAPPGGDGPGVAPAPPGPPGGLPSPAPPPPGPPEGPAPPGPDPAHLVVEATSVELGGAASSATFGLANDGGSPAPWTASATPGWLSVSPASGVVGPGARTDVTVTIDRGAAPEGSLSGKVTVTVPGAVVGSVTVRAVDDRPPAIHSVGSDDSDLFTDGCGRSTTTVRAVVTDGSGLERVVLTVEGPDGARTSRSMTADGTEWSAPLGPFSSAGTATWSVTATDRYGNLARSRTVTVPIEACTRPPTGGPPTGAPR
ncbi:MAG: BACON domain-containing protein, partial [Acidimicrobiia bacterium]